MLLQGELAQLPLTTEADRLTRYFYASHLVCFLIVQRKCQLCFKGQYKTLGFTEQEKSDSLKPGQRYTKLFLFQRCSKIGSCTCKETARLLLPKGCPQK